MKLRLAMYTCTLVQPSNRMPKLCVLQTYIINIYFSRNVEYMLDIRASHFLSKVNTPASDLIKFSTTHMFQYSNVW